MLPLCRSEGIAVVPWSPLARGFLAGGRAPGGGETARARTDQLAHGMYYAKSDFQVAGRVAAVAAGRGVSPAQVALAWLLHQPGVTAPIIGATRLSHLEQAVAAIPLTLDDDERAALEEPYRPHRVLGHE